MNRAAVRGWLVLTGISAALALAVLAPLLSRGFVLTYDMVFAPTQSLLADGIGVGSTLPRSVPADALVALATQVLAGDIVQKILLFLALFGGALGAGRLVPTTSMATRVVATVAYGWSAYLAERLLMGHWPYLLAYACLPWITMAALALRRGASGSLPKLVLACVPACITPTGGIIAAGAALAGGGWRQAARTAPVVVVLNAPCGCRPRCIRAARCPRSRASPRSGRGRRVGPPRWSACSASVGSGMPT
jgi:hypothetical protein